MATGSRAAADQTSTWETQDPAEENLAQLLPVDTPEIHVDKRNVQHGASNALRLFSSAWYMGGVESGVL